MHTIKELDVVCGTRAASMYTISRVIDCKLNGGIGVRKLDNPLTFEVFFRVRHRPARSGETATGSGKYTATLAGVAVRLKHVALLAGADKGTLCV